MNQQTNQLSGTTAAGFAADTAELPGCGWLGTGGGRGAGYAADAAELPGCGRLRTAGVYAADPAHRHPARSAGHALLSGSDFHAAVQAGSLNVNVGSQRVASNLAFGNFSTYYCFAEGFRTVSLINAGSGRTLLLRKTVPMSYGEQLTFVIVNNASTGALELVRVNDTACSGQMGGFGCLRMANFLLGDTALDLLTADGRVLFSDVRYKETTLSRRLRPGSYSFLVANTPVRIEPRIQDVEMDQGEWRISQRYLPGYGEMDLPLSFGMQARRGVLSTAYIIGQANTGEVQVVVSENR